MKLRLRKSGIETESLKRIGLKIRSHLDSDDVLRTLVEEVHRALRTTRTSVWLSIGDGDPHKAVSAGSRAAPPDETVLPLVKQVVRTGRSVADGHTHAAPIVAPRWGLLGVLTVESPSLDAGMRVLVDDLAVEGGYALGTANLYEQAVAGREKSEAILKRVGDAVVVTDTKGRVLDWNQSAEIALGAGAEAAIGQSCPAVLGLMSDDGPLDCSTGCALLARLSGDGIGGGEVWRHRHDGRKQPLLVTVATVTDKAGTVFEIVHSMRDITRLKQADEAKTMFLATASHELKTPLTVIQGFAQLLGSARVSDQTDRDQAIEAIERRARQLNRIVDRLLLSSRIEAGRAEVKPTEMDLAPILAEEVTSAAKATDRTIVYEEAEPLPRILGDVDAVITVVQHLLDNAAKYSPDGGPVKVRAWAQDGSAFFSVRDHGIGMDAEQAAHCFDKFWQAESTDVRRFGGTGIGLFIVRSLVEAMRGEIIVESAPGKGSTFTVRLGRETTSSPPEPTVTPEMAPAPEPEPSVIREFMRQLGIPSRK